jgi:diguanylate cyclase (GGDEF)-like protein
MDPLLAEGAALVCRFRAVSGPPDPAAEEEELAFFDAITDVVEAVGEWLHTVETSRHAALHDPLTGLANRSLVIDHLQVALARAGRRSTLAAVVFLDLDDFKRINDTLGHRAGDELLAQVADRLRGAVRPTDILGRWGGDEFVVVCDDLQLAADVSVIIERIAAAFEIPFHVHGADLSMAASIGVAVSGGTDDPATLIAAADSGMYRAKRDHETPRPDRPEAPVLLAQVLPPKGERLTIRLLELLSTVGDVETPAGTDESAVSTATTPRTGR